VQAAEVDNSIRLIVRDRGIGIPQVLREQVFQPFFSTHKNSSGLGLSIVKQLTEQHGGTVRLLEPEEGEGCVVEVLLPLPLVPEDQA
jgi:signal transduction histidine kinase